jgi:hypothetical protein
MDYILLRTSDSSHSILQPNLHDGRLLGINIPVDGCVELTVQSLDGRQYRILLEGTREFWATDFRAGNIILDVTLARGREVRIADVEALACQFQGEVRSAEHVQRIYERVLRESLFVLELNPSYGCHLIAVSQRILVYDETT